MNTTGVFWIVFAIIIFGISIGIIIYQEVQLTKLSKQIENKKGERIMVSLSKEVIQGLPKLRVTKLINDAKREKKSAEDLATDIIDTLENELHFGVVEEK
jgi:3-isopropylmalate dehydratase small subunit